MLKNTTYKEKFELLKEWVPSIVDHIKKDLKNDHLRQDHVFYKRYFASKNINKLTTEELYEAYSQALIENEKAEELAEFISSRWLIKNSELYNYFEAELSLIAKDFTEIEEIDLATSRKILAGSIDLHGAPRTYLFSVLNSVVFPPQVYEELKQQAHSETEKQATDQKEKEEKATLENVKFNHEQQMNRLIDKYEKKLAGLQKKYHADVKNLKDQLVKWQRKESQLK